jgi:hypothetical protein
VDVGVAPWEVTEMNKERKDLVALSMGELLAGRVGCVAL